MRAVRHDYAERLCIFLDAQPYRVLFAVLLKRLRIVRVYFGGIRAVHNIAVSFPDLHGVAPHFNVAVLDNGYLYLEFTAITRPRSHLYCHRVGL